MNIQKLLDRSEPWLQYAIHVNMPGTPKQDLLPLRDAALSDERIQNSLRDIAHFHNALVTYHKNPDLPLHKLLFLLSLGFDTDIPQIQSAIDQILEHHDEDGVYQSLTNVPKKFGGAGEDVFGWCLCDAPILLLCLIKAGVNYDRYVKAGVGYLVSLSRTNGFPCAVSPELGTYRGPGRKIDCCPYATLIMADLLAHLPQYRQSPVAVTAAQALLSLWENSLAQHPYMFFMGTDFRKLKAPSCWYDLVSVANVISQYARLRHDPRFLEMLALIKSKRDEDGFYTPQSIYQKSKAWDFGQKKSPSAYLTYLCLRIFARCGQDEETSFT